MTYVRDSGGGNSRTHPRAARKAPKRRPRKPAPTPQTDVQSSGGDYGIPKANRAKKTKVYKKAARAGYEAAPIARRRQILKNAKSTEGAVARKTHRQRAARRREIERSTTQHDVLGNDDLKVAAAALRRAMGHQSKSARPYKISDAHGAAMQATRKHGGKSPKSTIKDLLKPELEGHGLIAAGLSAAAQHVGKSAIGPPAISNAPSLAGKFAKDLANA